MKQITKRQLWASVRKRAGDPRKAYPVDDDTMALATDEATVRTGAKAATFVVTSRRQDRDSDIVLPLGISTENWRKAGAPWFFSHGSEKFPIGTSLDASGKLHFQADEDTATATIFFDMGDPFAREVQRKVCVVGSLRACSVAFVPVQAESLGKANHSGDGHGFLFRSVDLTEISIVPIPSQPDAVLIGCSAGIGKRLKRCVGAYCKMFGGTQGDIEPPGLPGRSANPPGDAEQEGCDCKGCTSGKTCCGKALSEQGSGGYTVGPREVMAQLVRHNHRARLFVARALGEIGNLDDPTLKDVLMHSAALRKSCEYLVGKIDALPVEKGGTARDEILARYPDHDDDEETTDELLAQYRFPHTLTLGSDADREDHEHGHNQRST
jgi:hypothetical protein